MWHLDKARVSLVLTLVSLLALPATAAALTRAAVPYDAARVYWRSSTLLPIRSQIDPNDPDERRVRARIYEFLTVGSRDVGVDGLSVEVSGWAVGELNDPYDEYEDDGFRGDLLYGHVSWRGLDDDLQIRLGRQFVWQGAGNGLILDGLHVQGRLPLSFEVSAYGGWVAPIRFRYDEEERIEDYAAGGRIAYAPWDWGHIGVSYAHTGDDGNVAREQLGVDASFDHFRWFELYGYTLVDMVNRDLDESHAILDFMPLDGLRVGVSYKGVDTTSRLNKTSIFHVFSDSVYYAVGGDIDWQSEGMLGVSAGYTRFIYDDDEADGGNKVDGEVRLLLDRDSRDVVGIQYGRLEAPTNAYHQVRAYARYTLLDGLYLAGDVNNFFYDAEVRGYDRTHFAKLIAGWEILPGLEVQGDLGTTIDPKYEYQIHGMLRLVYQGAAAVGG